MYGQSTRQVLQARPCNGPYCLSTLREAALVCQARKEAWIAMDGGQLTHCIVAKAVRSMVYGIPYVPLPEQLGDPRVGLDDGLGVGVVVGGGQRVHAVQLQQIGKDGDRVILQLASAIRYIKNLDSWVSA